MNGGVPFPSLSFGTGPATARSSTGGVGVGGLTINRNADAWKIGAAFVAGAALAWMLKR